LKPLSSNGTINDTMITAQSGIHLFFNSSIHKFEEYYTKGFFSSLVGTITFVVLPTARIHA
jgi:hypothetical protein